MFDRFHYCDCLRNQPTTCTIKFWLIALEANDLKFYLQRVCKIKKTKIKGFISTGLLELQVIKAKNWSCNFRIFYERYGKPENIQDIGKRQRIKIKLHRTEEK